MPDDVALALAITNEIRKKARLLGSDDARVLEQDLGRIESKLQSQGDPYARVMDVLDLQNRLRQSAGVDPNQQPRSQTPPQSSPAPAPAAPPPAPQTSLIGERVATALEAVDFTGFVSSLITGTFRAIVDASAAQMREYANLVSSIAQTLESFTGENVSANQARDHLAEQYPKDLVLKLPPAGSTEQPRIEPRPERVGESPEWLKKYGLEGEELSQELVEGPLLEAARKKVAEGRLSSLASMVLMGVNRIVVNEGDIRAKVQFHAAAIDVQRAEYQTQTTGIAARDAGASGQVGQMLVSTLKANAQADAAIKADLTGEVRVSFRSETFPLERFADSAAIQLINQHAKWRTDQAAASGTGPAGVVAAAPAPSTTPPPVSEAQPAGGAR
jgi:hypothetical protein